MSQTNTPHNTTSFPPYTHASSPPLPYSPRNQQQQSLTPNDVSRIVGNQIKQGQKIKGQSRITYMPYEKKIIEYEQKQYIERVPKIKKIVQYQQRKIVEQVPREVTTTDYYAVQNIKQYYKQVIPQTKIQYVPIQKKIKKVQYIPVQKQIVHYPQGQQNHDLAKGQSRVVLQSQGVLVREDAQYKKIDPKLIYKYSQTHGDRPLGYVEDGHKRVLSNAPAYGGYQSQVQVRGPDCVYYPQIPNISVPIHVQPVQYQQQQQYVQYQQQPQPQYQQQQVQYQPRGYYTGPPSQQPQQQEIGTTYNGYGQQWQQQQGYSPRGSQTVYNVKQDISFYPNSQSNYQQYPATTNQPYLDGTYITNNTYTNNTYSNSNSNSNGKIPTNPFLQTQLQRVNSTNSNNQTPTNHRRTSSISQQQQQQQQNYQQYQQYQYQN